MKTKRKAAPVMYMHRVTKARFTAEMLKRTLAMCERMGEPQTVESLGLVLAKPGKRRAA